MTREEAIRCIEARMIADDVIYAADLYYPEALNMAIEALEEQEPRVMTLEEVQKANFLWIEQVGVIVPAMKVATSKENGRMLFAYTHDGGVFNVNIEPKHYEKISRCWTSRPTDEQREATPWN